MAAVAAIAGACRALALYQVRDGGRVVEALMPIMKAFEAGKAPIPAFTPAQLRGVLEDDQACASSCSASNVVKRKLRCAGECGMVILTTALMNGALYDAMHVQAGGLALGSSRGHAST